MAALHSMLQSVVVVRRQQRGSGSTKWCPLNMLPPAVQSLGGEQMCMLNGSIAQHASSVVVVPQQQHVAREHQMAPTWIASFHSCGMQSLAGEQMCMLNGSIAQHASSVVVRAAAGSMWPGSTKWCPRICCHLL